MKCSLPVLAWLALAVPASSGSHNAAAGGIVLPVRHAEVIAEQLWLIRQTTDESDWPEERVLGASGQWTTATGLMGPDCQAVYRGVSFDVSRPQSAARDAIARDSLQKSEQRREQETARLINELSRSGMPAAQRTALTEELAEWQHRPIVRMTGADVPTDVFLFVSSTRLRLAADWNADLRIETAEIHDLQPGDAPSPDTASTGEAVAVQPRIVVDLASPLAVSELSPAIILKASKVESTPRLLAEFRFVKAGHQTPQHPDITAIRPAPVDRRERALSDRPSWWDEFRKDSLAAELSALRRESNAQPQAILDSAQRRLAESPSDVEAQRFLMLALDQPEIRKQHLQQVVDAASQVIAATESDTLSRDRRTAWRVDALYRRGRALGYMELPDVIAEKPIADRAAHNEAFIRNYEQLDELVDMNQPEFILLAIRHERRQKQPAAAWQRLQIYRATHPDPRWYFRKQRDLFREMKLGLPERLGWALDFLEGNPAQSGTSLRLAPIQRAGGQ